MIRTCLATLTVLGGAVLLHPGVSARPLELPKDAVPVHIEGPVTYSIENQHGGVVFEIRHLGLSTVTGRFNNFQGKIVENEKELEKSSVEFSADVNTIDTGVAARDAHLKGKDYFDTEKFGKISFRSTAIRKTKGGYRVTGNLTVKDITKPVTLNFKHYGPYVIKGYGDQPPRVGVIADPIVIKRADFGIGTADLLPDGTEGASNAVTIRISLEATLDQ